MAILASFLKNWKAFTGMHRLITYERDEDHLHLQLPQRILASMKERQIAELVRRLASLDETPS